MHKKDMSKVLATVISIFGLCLFLVLAIVSSSNDKLVAEIIALIGGCLFMLKGAEAYRKKIGLESKLKNIKILPWSIILILLFVVAWSFL